MTLRSLSDCATRQNVSDIHTRFVRAVRPEVSYDFMLLELALEADEHLPVEIAQFDDMGVMLLGRLIGTSAGFESSSPHMADAEREQALGGMIL